MSDLVDRLNAALAGRYRLERELGRGGMATVFLASDLKHHRRVAIKVLHPELAAAIGPERFLREIEIAAQLQHPHIIALFDSGEASGALYYVMPYIEGESLRVRLDRERQLSVEDALRLAGEVADALDYAHGQGLIHRDIKPENILLASGHAMVADFGIARAMRAAGGTKLTETGTVLGTPAYMSPEQVISSGEIDGRTDVYSLACVLYEMLAGVPPFVGATAESLAHQHLSVEPRPVTSIRPTVPDAAARALAKALAKTPADRFDTPSRFAQAMRGPSDTQTSAGSGTTRRRWLVAGGVGAFIVLALGVWRLALTLVGHYPPAGQRAWVLVAEFDGLAAESTVVAATRDLVMAALDQSEVVATVPGDQVREALQMAGKPTSTRVDDDLARELAYRSAVRTVLEGRIGRLGKGYSVVLRLVDVDSARVVVSVSDAARDEEDLISTVGRIAKKLRWELGERRAAVQATRELAWSMTPSFEAYKAYQRARDLLSVSYDYQAAMVEARSALVLDPDYPGPWIMIGRQFANFGRADSALEAFRHAQAHPERLTERERLLISMTVADLNGDVAGALSLNERMVRLNPENWAGYNDRCFHLLSAGHGLSEAFESLKAAEKASPFGPNQFVLGNQLNLLLALGRVNEARKLVPRLRGALGMRAPMWVAAAANEWTRAESLAVALRSDPVADDILRPEAGEILAVAQASKGSLTKADQTLRELQLEVEAGGLHPADDPRWTRLMLSLFARGVAIAPVNLGRSDSTAGGLLTRGTWAAAEGNTMEARVLLATALKRPGYELADKGIMPAVLEAWIAARAERWQDVVRILGPAALKGEATGIVTFQSAPLVRWLVAEAYERMDRPDSAAAYFERAITPPPTGGTNTCYCRLALAFGHRRLVLLNARMGRLQSAHRHWEMFSETVTAPDSEMMPMVQETRSALMRAEGKRGTVL